MKDYDFEMDDALAILIRGDGKEPLVGRPMKTAKPAPEYKRTRAITADSHWRLMSHVTSRLEAKRVIDGTPQLIPDVRRMFEACLPITSAGKHIADVVARDLYHAVNDVPLPHREMLCARLLAFYDVPAPPEPKVKTHHIIEREIKIQPRLTRSYVVDIHGNAWSWNCGWRIIDEQGNVKFPKKKPLGILTFSRSIVMASDEELGRTSFRYTRPWGMWRKVSGAVAHDTFGNGSIIVTDGVHAVVKFAHGREEVVLDNLRNIGERQLTHAPKEIKEKTQRTTKVQISLEQLMEMF